MSSDTMAFVLGCLLLAILITAYELNEATKPQYRKGCRECAHAKREAEEQEKRRQEQLRREYEERLRRLNPPGAGMGEGTSAEPPEPPKRSGGGWMA
jgi:3'-phosphoadenosine 5'-phosphosulfate sulfotransferase (PAPS reductase)/FAD synthetase